MMNPNSVIPQNMIQDDLMAQSKTNEENLRLSIIKLNEVSGNYRNTLSLIDEKIIYLAAGSISLFLTFIGILFNSPKDASTLRFEFVFLSIFSFVITIVILLIARWLWSLYIFSISHGHYLQNLKSKHETEVSLFRSGSSFINHNDYSQMDSAEMEAMAKKIETRIKKIDKQIANDAKKEKSQSRIAKALSLSAYGVLLLAYIFATIFFFDLVKIIS